MSLASVAAPCWGQRLADSLSHGFQELEQFWVQSGGRLSAGSGGNYCQQVLVTFPSMRPETGTTRQYNPDRKLLIVRCVAPRGECENCKESTRRSFRSFARTLRPTPGN